MGHKAHSSGLRLNVHKNWNSLWYTDYKYDHLLHLDLVIRSYLVSIFKQHGILVGHLHIRRSCTKTHILINIYDMNSKKESLDMDLVIKSLSSLLTGSISIRLIKQVDVTQDIYIFSKHLCNELEKRVPFKVVLKEALGHIKDSSNILGVRINFSGRLNGVEIARMEWARDGRLPLHTLNVMIHYAFSEAHTIYGVLGVKVWLYYK